MTVRRNVPGRQADSSGNDLDVPGIDGGPVHPVFIRAPWVAHVGDGVTGPAEAGGYPVAAGQARCWRSRSTRSWPGPPANRACATGSRA